MIGWVGGWRLGGWVGESGLDAVLESTGGGVGGWMIIGKTYLE